MLQLSLAQLLTMKTEEKIMAEQPNLQELMKKAKEMQEKMQVAQDELSKMEIVGKAGDDKIYVEVTMTGRHDAKKVFISNDAFAEKKEIVEDLTAAAINDATRKVETASQKKIVDMTKAMGLPTELPATPPSEEGE